MAKSFCHVGAIMCNGTSSGTTLLKLIFIHAPLCKRCIQILNVKLLLFLVAYPFAVILQNAQTHKHDKCNLIRGTATE